MISLNEKRRNTKKKQMYAYGSGCSPHTISIVIFEIECAVWKTYVCTHHTQTEVWQAIIYIEHELNFFLVKLIVLRLCYLFSQKHNTQKQNYFIRQIFESV